MVPKTVRFGAGAAVAGGSGVGTVGGCAGVDIMRFWNSLCLFLSLSSGWALRAMPSVYASSASIRLQS